MRDRNTPALPALAAHAIGAVVVLVASFMPWIRSGARRRSSYDILDIARRLGFSPNGALGWAVRCWPLMPFLLVASILAAASAWPRTAAALNALVAVWVVTVAVTVRRAPTSALIGVEAGTWVSIVGASLLAAAAVLSAMHHVVATPSAARSAGPS